MMTFPNGNKYKLVYLDTNCINDISKNKQKMGKMFFEHYCIGGYMFVTSVFNLFELSKTKGESRKKVIEIFDKFPLAIIQTFPQLIEFEKIESDFNQNMIMFAIGPKPIFNVQIDTILRNIENDGEFQNSINKMKRKFENEILNWSKKQEQINWWSDFKSYLLKSMNESFKIENNYFEIQKLGKYKSLEILAFIKNQFIYNSKKKILISSVIDSYNCSILPYIDVYITEKTVGSWLEQGKSKFQYIRDKEIVKISDLYE